MTTRQPTEIEVAERKDIAGRFATFTTTDDQRVAMEQVRDATREFVDTIFRLVPSTRERALAFTAIEEGKYWANQAIAKNGPSDIDWTGVNL